MFRVAVVGAGGMAFTHARAYSDLPNSELVAIMDTRAEAAQKLAELHGARLFTDFDAMLAATKPDIVDVCVPTPFHADYVCRAVPAGLKGIVVEKPMARTVEDCDRMAAACSSAGVPLFVAHVLRFFPEFVTARSKIRAGAVGNPATIRSRRGGPFPRAWENWYGKYEMSGGCVLDLIIHDFDWLRWTFGEVERVFAKGCVKGISPGSVMERDFALITLRFKSGALGHVEGTWADPGGFKVSFEVAGDQGLLEYNFNQPTMPPLQSAFTKTEGAMAGVAVPESPTAVNPYQAELAHFLDCLERGIDPDITPADGREAVRIALAALKSIETGLPVTL